MKDDVANSKRLEIHLVLKRVSQTIDSVLCTEHIYGVNVQIRKYS